MQLPLVARTLPAGKRPGVITIDAASLTRAHLEAVGADPETPIVGVDPHGTFARAIMDDLPSLDAAAAEQEMLAAGDALVAQHRDIGAVVLECANMPPYAAALRARLRVPVHDMVGFGCWLYVALSPRAYRR
jgi:Asp/Glu/hydantoin racemase